MKARKYFQIMANFKHKGISYLDMLIMIFYKDNVVLYHHYITLQAFVNTNM